VSDKFDPDTFDMLDMARQPLALRRDALTIAFRHFRSLIVSMQFTLFFSSHYFSGPTASHLPIVSESGFGIVSIKN
jgi:hypothetical protein